MKTPQLIQPPNGAYVRPDTVTSVCPLPTETGCLGDLHRARVAVHHGGFIELLMANDDQHAQQMADEIAAKCNTITAEAAPTATP